MKKIIIVPVGRVDREALDEISHGLASTFHAEVVADREIPLPPGSYDPGRRQYHSTAILKNLQAACQRQHFDLLLGVTDVDLYVPALNFVFGEADMSAGVTVISLARLRQEFYGLPPDRKLFEERAVKEAVHELGHALGLRHCPDPACIMHFSNSLLDTDRKGPGFCDICKERLDLSNRL